MRSVAFGVSAAVCAVAFVFLGAGRPAQAADGELILTKAEPVSAAIVVPENADSSIKTFAALLQKRLEQSLGRKLPLQSEKAGPTVPVEPSTNAPTHGLFTPCHTTKYSLSAGE